MVEALMRSNGRGHDAVGIVASSPVGFHRFVKEGFVREACQKKNPRFVDLYEWMLRNGAGVLIGHTRYSTVGGTAIENAQPFKVQSRFGWIYVAHNGQLVGHEQYRKELTEAGHTFTSESDSEVLATLITHKKATSLEDAIAQVIQTIPGVYSLVVIAEDRIIAARDGSGNRPLFTGKMEDGGVAVASESGVLYGLADIQEVPPGAMVTLSQEGGLELVQVLEAPKRAECVLEAIYFARPDRDYNGRPASAFRQACGKQLARIYPIQADIVCGVPDSGNYAAFGYAQESGITYGMGAILKNMYSGNGRTFTHPGNGRKAIAGNKYTITESLVRGKSVIVVDDSLVRGTTGPIITEMLFKAGAREVHWVIASPPVKGRCTYGIDIPKEDQLISYQRSILQICEAIGATSLAYLPLDVMESVASGYSNGWCTGCFSGNYPIQLTV